jgi:hypothetical protein
MQDYKHISTNKNGTLNRYVTLDTFEAHKGLVKGMMKCEKIHEKTNPKATIKLVRLEKKFISFSRKLRRLLGD